MKVSRFSHFLEGNRIRHSLTKQVISLPTYIYSALSDNPVVLDELLVGGALDELVAGGFVVKGLNADDKLANHAQQTLSKPSIQSLFLMIKTVCNLNCSYCLLGWDEAETLLSPVKTMTMETAARAIELFAVQVADNGKPDGYWQAVTFYGGEPMLNLEVLIGTVELIERKRDSGQLWNGTEIILNTNGVLIDKSFAVFAAKSGIEVQVSLDGFQPEHDLNRVDHHGNGSFQRAVRGIELLVAAGAKTVPMITVNDQNMHTLTEFVHWMGIELGIAEYMMNILMSETGGSSQDYSKRAARAMWDTYHSNLKYGMCDNQYAGQLDAFAPDAPICRPSCGANGRKLTVFPDGQVHTCQALNNAEISHVGEVWDFSVNNPTWNDWSSRNRFNHSTCLDCPVVGSCGAGCAAGAYRATGSIHSFDPNHCHWLKETFRLWRNSV